MVVQRREAGNVRFCVQPENGARSVELVGEFIRGRRLPMRRRSGNRFVTDLWLPVGRHDCSFIVDGWQTIDPAGNSPNAHCGLANPESAAGRNDVARQACASG